MKTTARTLWNSILVVFLGTLLARQAGGQTLFKLLPPVPLQLSASGSVKVNQALNKIYVSGDPNSISNLQVVVIDGETFATTPVGPGQQVSVDNKTNRYWAETVNQHTVIVRDGMTNNPVATIQIPGGVCPIQSNYAFRTNRMWVSAQCGALHDPIFAINATTFVITRSIDSGGIMEEMIANGVNGRLYFTINCCDNPVSKRVLPRTFAVTANAFGSVVAIDAFTNTLFALDGNNLQIIDGRPDPEQSVQLPLHIESDWTEHRS